MSTNHYLKLAIDEAWKYQFVTYPNPAVGACVVKNGKVISVEAHQKAGLPHAEVNALKKAYLVYFPDSKIKFLLSSYDIHTFLIENHNNFFNDCEIYVTLEPCNHIGKTPSCANLIQKLKLKKVFIGTKDPNKLASGGIDTLSFNNIKYELLNDKNSQNLIYPFLKWQNNNFIFFKLAMREDGTITGGYITTQDSLNLVHTIRTKLNLLVIGGNTVRIDQPTLDSRFAHTNKSSDILIYSNTTNFDQKIPLFHIKNRDVYIQNNLNILKDKNFVMIEGGYSLFHTLKNKLDYLMLFISHKDRKQNHFDINEFGFKLIHSYYLNNHDEILFLKATHK